MHFGFKGKDQKHVYNFARKICFDYFHARVVRILNYINYKKKTIKEVRSLDYSGNYKRVFALSFLPKYKYLFPQQHLQKVFLRTANNVAQRRLYFFLFFYLFTYARVNVENKIPLSLKWSNVVLPPIYHQKYGTPKWTKSTRYVTDR